MMPDDLRRAFKLQIAKGMCSPPGLGTDGMETRKSLPQSLSAQWSGSSKVSSVQGLKQPVLGVMKYFVL